MGLSNRALYFCSLWFDGQDSPPYMLAVFCSCESEGPELVKVLTRKQAWWTISGGSKGRTLPRKANIRIADINKYAWLLFFLCNGCTFVMSLGRRRRRSYSVSGSFQATPVSLAPTSALDTPPLYILLCLPLHISWNASFPLCLLSPFDEGETSLSSSSVTASEFLVMWSVSLRRVFYLCFGGFQYIGLRLRVAWWTYRWSCVRVSSLSWMLVVLVLDFGAHLVHLNWFVVDRGVLVVFVFSSFFDLTRNAILMLSKINGLFDVLW